MATCVYCGEKLREGEVCCHNCGRPVPREMLIRQPVFFRKK